MGANDKILTRNLKQKNKVMTKVYTNFQTKDSLGVDFRAINQCNNIAEIAASVIKHRN